MKHSLRILACLFVFCCGQVSMADVTLDDFESGSLIWSSLFSDGATYSSSNPLPGAVGDLRLIQHAPNGASSSSFITSTVSGGSLNVTYSDSQLSGFGVIHGVYGGLNGIPASGSGEVEGSQLMPLDNLLDLSNETEIRLDYTYNGIANGGVIAFYAFGGPTLDENVFDQSANFFLQSGSGQLVLDLSTFFNSVDPSEISAIGFLFVSLFDGDASFDNFQATGGVVSGPTTADSMTIERGVLLAGDVSDTTDSDDMTTTIERVTGLNRLGKMSIVFDATLPSDSPSGLAVEIESRADVLRINQSMSMFNYSSSQFELVDFNQISTTDQTNVITLGPNYLDYIEPGTGAVKVRLQYEPAPLAVIGRQAWTVDIDQIIWTD